MVKVLVVYDTKHGNTKLVAEKIVEGLRQGEGIEVEISDVEKTDVDRVADFDAVLLGVPTHFGGPTRTITRFIDDLGRQDMKGKQAAVFDTYLGEDFEKSVKKMEQRIAEKTGLHMITPGLSVRVAGMKGPVAEDELPKARDFGTRIANHLKK
jgi:flavodoxin